MSQEGHRAIRSIRWQSPMSEFGRGQQTSCINDILQVTDAHVTTWTDIKNT